MLTIHILAINLGKFSRMSVGLRCRRPLQSRTKAVRRYGMAFGRRPTNDEPPDFSPTNFEHTRQESDRKNSLDAGFDYHLVKPADFPKVLKILATVTESLLT